MKNLAILTSFFILALATMISCSEDSGTAPSINAGIIVGGETLEGLETMVPIGTQVKYKFEVYPDADLKKIEIWRMQGVGQFTAAPTLWKVFENLDFGNEFIYEEIIDSLAEDLRISIYAEDINGNYNHSQLTIFLDVTRYSITLYDGLTDGTSLTFLDVENGRGLYIANTIADPEAVDFGFAFMEFNENAMASIVSFDEYYKTSAYPMVTSPENNRTLFKRSVNLENELINEPTILHIYERLMTKESVRQAYEEAEEISHELSFSQGAVAPMLLPGSVISFVTQNEKYGVFQVTALDSKNNSMINDQTITLDIIIQK